MAGTRTAPTVDGTGFSFVQTSFRWIDYTGEKRSDSYKLDAATTPAEIEALAAAAQAISNASLYRIDVADVYGSVEDKSNADEEVWEEASANLVLQARNVTGDSIRFFLPAPNEGIMIEETETIDPTDTDLAALIAAFVATLPTGYSVVGARFTSRRQMGQQVKI